MSRENLAQLLDEIVEELLLDMPRNDEEGMRQMIRAACIRARETDQRRSFTTVDGMRENIDLRDKLAAVREWAAESLSDSALNELDAILDGKEAE